MHAALPKIMMEEAENGPSTNRLFSTSFSGNVSETCQHKPLVYRLIEANRLNKNFKK